MSPVKKTESGVVLLSGGLDSAVVLGIALQECSKIITLFLAYGQKTINRELQSFHSLNKFYSEAILLSQVVDLSWLKTFGISALFDQETMLDETNPQAEYVPFRNTIFLAVAAAFSESKNLDRIYIGSTGGDRICPDNSSGFITAFQQVLEEGSLIKRDIRLKAPLLSGTKNEVVKQGVELKTPFHLTWSCHNNTQVACGRCSNCRARRQAFIKNHIQDPIAYEK